MAGLIRREDIDTVRERSRIDEVAGEHVSLKPAGVGALKGLCPFHDERTASFTVRPAQGYWHCFGCGEGGDVISFVQKLHHLPFTEAVEMLAEKYGVPLRYEAGQKRASAEPGRRQRLIEAHRVAGQFYQDQLKTAAAQQAVDFLVSRNFTQDHALHFGVGYAPDSYDALLRHLRSNGFTDDELALAGLVINTNRGPIDRFRGRLMWPIRDLTGATIGFGARRLGDDDNQPKYLNTPETPIYKKSRVLYGIDLAKKDIARGRKVVVVEGYTDVMAAHAAGETTAVATCGTAFGTDHAQMIRRIMGDTASPASGVVLASGRAPGGEVIFTFDGDEAGKTAARRAYRDDQTFAAQTFVAVDPNGMDPCDLRVSGGDQAVLDLIASRVPLFEFVLRSVLAPLPLDTAEGRVAGLRACVPILAGIKDVALQRDYIRQVAGWVGTDVTTVANDVAALARSQRQMGEAPAAPARSAPRIPIQMPTDPMLVAERLALAAVLQHPAEAVGTGFEEMDADTFADSAHKFVFDIINGHGGLDAYFEELERAQNQVAVEEAAPLAARRWFKSLTQGLDDSSAAMLGSIAMTRLPMTERSDVRQCVQGLVHTVLARDLVRRQSVLRSQANRAVAGSDEQQRALTQLMELERRRRELTSPT